VLSAFCVSYLTRHITRLCYTIGGSCLFGLTKKTGRKHLEDIVIGRTINEAKEQKHKTKTLERRHRNENTERRHRTN